MASLWHLIIIIIIIIIVVVVIIICMLRPLSRRIFAEFAEN